VLGFVGKVVRRTSDKGLRDTAGWAWFRVNEEYREWRLGVHTKGYIDRSDLGQDETSAHYEPTRYPWVRAVLRHMTIRPGKDVLVDYGAGMGRIVAAAAQHPFARIVGIELSEQLSSIARDNLPRIRGRKCDDVEVLTGDAATFAPPEDMSHAFLFNPFYPPVIHAVRDRIQASLRARPRPLTEFRLFVYRHQPDGQ